MAVAAVENKPAVGYREAVTVGVVFTSAKIFLSYQIILYHLAAGAAWAVPFLEAVIAAIGLLSLVSVLERYPGKSIVEITEELLGPYLNTLFSMIFSAILVLISGVVLRQNAERALTGFYPDTPISIVVLLIMFGTVIVTYLGFDTVARVAALLAPFLLLGLAVIVALSIPMWQPTALFPLLGAGAEGILRASLEQTGSFTELFIMGVVAPFLPRGRLKAIGIWTVIISTLLLVAFVLVPLLVFTYPVVTELTLPMFEMNRLITAGRFGERMETLFLPIWALTGLIKITVGLYGAASVTAQYLKLNDYRPFILPMAVFTMAAAFLPPNISTAVVLDVEVLRRYSFAVVMAMFLPVMVISLRRGKGGAKGGKKSG
ncbi:MAG: GerAB/ArcD/ProY family transporter [Bacillota bacterium]